MDASKTSRKDRCLCLSLCRFDAKDDDVIRDIMECSLVAPLSSLLKIVKHRFHGGLLKIWICIDYIHSLLKSLCIDYCNTVAFTNCIPHAI
jgi:hypothetical protein